MFKQKKRCANNPRDLLIALEFILTTWESHQAAVEGHAAAQRGGGAHGEGWVQIDYPPDFTSACLVGISAISQNYFSIKINYLKTITLRKSQCAFRQDKLVPN